MGADLGADAGPLSDAGDVGRGSIAPVVFFLAPVLMLALAVAVRASHGGAGVREVAERVLAHQDAASAASDETGVSLPLILAMMTVESGGRPGARSPANAVGLMQLRPATAREMAGGEDLDLTDPRTSLRLGARYLREQLHRFRDRPCSKELALAAYNAGPTKVLSWLRERPLDAGRTELGEWIPFRETRAYVPRVLKWERYFRERLLSSARQAPAPPR